MVPLQIWLEDKNHRAITQQVLSIPEYDTRIDRDGMLWERSFINVPHEFLCRDEYARRYLIWNGPRPHMANLSHRAPIICPP